MDTRKAYEPPIVSTLDAKKILDLIGPAQGNASAGVDPYPSSPDPSKSSSGGGTFGRR